jgi:purine-binding chemotaxis protein CheW
MAEPPPVTPGNGDPSPGDIDWDEIRKRLKRMQAASGDGSAAASSRRKVLRERAEQLARPIEHDEHEGERLRVLEFTLANERYAIDASAVREVYSLKDITPVPGAPAYIIGVISVRGRIVSVMDLGRLFETVQRDADVFTMAIVVRSPRMEFAILADEVHGIEAIPVSRLQASMPTLTGARKKYLRGVTPERVAVLDAQRLLADDALIVRQERGVGR